MGIEPTIDITIEQRETILALLNRHLPDTEAWVYGSRVKWTSHPSSDLDMVVFSSSEQSSRVSELREAFEESNLPFRVDLFVWDDLPESFHPEIKSEHVVLVDNSANVSNFKSVRLGDCIEVNENTYSPKEAWPFVNYLDTGSITENRIEKIQHIVPEQEKLPSRARRKAEAGDIVYSTVRPIQRHFGMLRKVPENFLASTGFAVFRGQKKVVDTVFLYWFLTQNHIVEQLQTLAEHSTSTYPSIKPTDIEKLEIPLPSLPEQRVIAQILRALDDKIGLNQRNNNTLEQMARVIYKDWFVDFGPTRAKMEGRAPYLPPKIWDMFPNAFDDEGRPLGWKKGTIAEIADSPHREINPEEVPDSTPYIGLKHMPRRSISLSDWGDAGSVSSSKTQFYEGDILFGKLRPYFHKVGIAPLDGICSTDIIVVTPRQQHWRAYTIITLSSDKFINYTDQTSTGTRMPRTNWNTMAQYEIDIPPKKLLNAFHHTVQALLNQLSFNIREISTLVHVRDLALPRLMSGEIRLREFEQIAEESA